MSGCSAQCGTASPFTSLIVGTYQGSPIVGLLPYPEERDEFPLSPRRHWEPPPASQCPEEAAATIWPLQPWCWVSQDWAAHPIISLSPTIYLHLFYTDQGHILLPTLANSVFFFYTKPNYVDGREQRDINELLKWQYKETMTFPFPRTVQHSCTSTADLTINTNKKNKCEGWIEHAELLFINTSDTVISWS